MLDSHLAVGALVNFVGAWTKINKLKVNTANLDKTFKHKLRIIIVSCIYKQLKVMFTASYLSGSLKNTIYNI